MSIFFWTTTSMINAQMETNIINMTNTTTTKDLTVSIGELLLVLKGKGEGMRLTHIDKPELEVSWSGNGTLNGKIPIMDLGTAWSTLKDDGYMHTKGHGIIITFDNEVAKYTFSGIGKFDDNGKLRNLGSVNFDTTDNGVLSVLNNIVGVYADEIDQNGNSITKIWKLNK
ncbi:MAG TPA: hypothetical protein VFT83_05195 [Nitrososphaeraceae archaeon]|nr:hypothetical protein [Nitrososphaeraceae archaeon]